MKTTIQIIRSVLFRILAISIGVVGLVFLLASILFFIVAVKPELLINERSAKFAASLAKQSGIEISWNQLSIKIESYSWFKKKFFIQSQDLCIALPKSGLTDCNQKIEISITGSIAHFKPKLEELGPISIQKSTWKLLQKGSRVSGELDLKTIPSDGNELNPSSSWNFFISARTLLPDTSRLDTEITLKLDENSREKLQAGYFLKARYLKNKSNILGTVQGNVDSTHLGGQVSLVAKNWINGIPPIYVRGCDFQLNQKQNKKQGQLSLNCPVDSHFPIPLDFTNLLQVPSRVGAVIQAELQTSAFPPDLDKAVDGDIKVHFNPLLSPLFQGNGDVSLKLKGVPNDFPKNWELKSQTAVAIRVPYFEKLVKSLHNTDWAIPAPLNALLGRIDIGIDGTSEGEVGRFTPSLRTRLKSTHQVLNLDGTGQVHFEDVFSGGKFSTQFNLVLSEVLLELPHLNWSAPPALVPDRRIRRKAIPKDSDSTPLQYKITVQTNPLHPVKIQSNLANSLIPVQVRLELSESSPLQGKIGIEPFPLKFFRREANLKHFQLDLAPNMPESPVNGLIEVVYTDFTMKVQILSTLGKPKLVLTSSPPLPENQLIAALLFGRPLEELNSDQNQSIGNTQAAIADGAISLLSLQALASTPVESVGYDRTTGIASAKIRLGEGTSLNLGSSEETRVIGIRKRLSQFLTLETNLSKSTSVGESASAYLTWSHRY